MAIFIPYSLLQIDAMTIGFRAILTDAIVMSHDNWLGQRDIVWCYRDNITMPVWQYHDLRAEAQNW